MRHFLASLLLLASAGCFSVPASSSPVKGTDIGVIVHNYALAFREFLATQSEQGLVPANMLAPLPITAAEWSAGSVTSPAPVTATIDGVQQTTVVSCEGAYCKREIQRTYHDDLRIDQAVEIWYLRGATDTATDDRILGFTATTRFLEQVVSLTEATAPTSGKPWVVKSAYGFAPTDFRRSLTRELTYAGLTSDAAPLTGVLDFQTKEGGSHAAYDAQTGGWTYAQRVTYGSFRNLKASDFSASHDGDQLQAKQTLTYVNGFAYDPLDLTGTHEAWRAAGKSLAGGTLTASHDEKGWTRTIVFPSGQRFKRLTDSGTYLSASNRGSFVREIVGQRGTVKIEGTYRLRVPGVWELNATSNAGITLQFTLRGLELGDAFQGVWSQPDARATAPDTATFTIATQPDLTTHMLYTFDRSDTPFTPDEAGTLRFLPDTRGNAKVSVVKEVSGAEERHADYNLLVVAEGQSID